MQNDTMKSVLKVTHETPQPKENNSTTVVARFQKRSAFAGTGLLHTAFVPLEGVYVPFSHVYCFHDW